MRAYDTRAANGSPDVLRIMALTSRLTQRSKFRTNLQDQTMPMKQITIIKLFIIELLILYAKRILSADDRQC